MSPDDKRGLLELLRWMVDDLEQAFFAGVQVNPHVERIGNIRARLKELGPYAKKPYKAPELTQLDAADVVERLLATLSEGEIQMVLGRVAVRRQRTAHDEILAQAARMKVVSCTCSSERDLSKDGHERGCPEYGRGVVKTKGGTR